MISNARRYVVSGKFERDMEHGFTLLDWFTVVIVALALFYFGPDLIYILLPALVRMIGG